MTQRSSAANWPNSPSPSTGAKCVSLPAPSVTTTRYGTTPTPHRRQVSIPCPCSTWTVLAHWSEGGTPAMVAALGADLARVLHGEATWEYLAPVRIGDELTKRQTVADVSTRQGKRGGAMTMFTINTDFVNQHGEVAVRRTDILIEREV